MRVAAVITHKDEPALLKWNIEYHRFLGIEHFYVFDDGSETAPADMLSGLSYVTLFEREPIERDVPGILERTVALALQDHWIARQHLNAFRALVLAREAGYDWIAHFDCDELLSVGSAEKDSLRRTLGTVDKGVQQIRFFPTLELVQTKLFYGNVFAEAPFFAIPLKPRKFQRRRWFHDPVHDREFVVTGHLGQSAGKSIVRTAVTAVPMSSHVWIDSSGSRLRSVRLHHLLHYHMSDFRIVARKHRRPHPERYVTGNRAPYYPTRFWHDLVTQLTESELQRWYERYMVIPEGDAAAGCLRGRFPEHPPLFIREPTPARVFVKL